jgi:hypothetical protein
MHEYARFADDLMVLIDSHQRHEWLATPNAFSPTMEYQYQPTFKFLPVAFAAHCRCAKR